MVVSKAVMKNEIEKDLMKVRQESNTEIEEKIKTRPSKERKR